MIKLYRHDRYLMCKHRVIKKSKERESRQCICEITGKIIQNQIGNCANCRNFEVRK
jgi:hypothetical protein